MLRLAAPVAGLWLLSAAALPAQESHDAQVDTLFDALDMPRIITVMREEGLEYGQNIGAEMFPGGDGARWDSTVSAIYDISTMTAAMRDVFGAELQGDDIDAMTAFFISEPGATLIDLEISARRALLDEDVETASNENAAIAMADNTPRYQLVQRFVSANDLVETNVVGALNATYAFYMGLIDGGAMPPGLTPEIILQQVWSQEEEIRRDTTEWVYSFLLMAYQPVSDDDLETYIVFSQSDTGQDLNAALFAAFNAMFNDISRALGLASSQFMISQEL